LQCCNYASVICNKGAVNLSRTDSGSCHSFSHRERETHSGDRTASSPAAHSQEDAFATRTRCPTTPPGRDALRQILIADLPERGEVSARLLREGGETMADLIDMLTLDADAGRQVVYLLGEPEAAS
jgi:hypothetical protein